MNRSAKTGRAVTDEHTAANPDTTVREGKGADTLRLDWLASLGRRRGERAIIRINPSGRAAVDGHAGKSLRDAIDAAIEADKPESRAK